MPGPTVEPLEPHLADAVLRFVARELSRLPYAVRLTRALLSERVLTKDIAADAFSLVAADGDRVVGFLQGGPRPAADYAGPDFSAGVVNLLLHDPGVPEAGDALLSAALAEFRRRGARSAEAMTASGGYPFFRGLFCGAEPGLPEELPHVAAAFARAGLTVRQELKLMSRRLEDLPSGLRAPGDLAIEERDLPTTALWLRESWRGMAPRLAAARLSGAAAGRIVWAILPGVGPRSGPGDAKVGAIAELSVRSDLRRRGIGSELIRRALASMRSAGAAEVVVTAEADSEPAIAAYSAAGFAEAARMASFRRLILGG